MQYRRVGILMGGLGPERAVSLRSGQAVQTALKGRGYEVVPIDVDHQLDQTLRNAQIDVAFNALHGPYGEDGCVQGLLELLRIPYTGAGVMVSALCMDKLKSKELFKVHDVPSPKYYAVQSQDLPTLDARHGDFGFPVFVKPRSQGSSVGAGRANNLQELRATCVEALRFDAFALVEQYVPGSELTVGLLDGKALGIVEIVPQSENYDYRAKYGANGSAYFCPPRLPAETQAHICNCAEKAAAALDATQGAPRVDLRWNAEDGPQIMEVNTSPGMTATSLLPKVAAAVGMDFGALCDAILQRAQLNVQTVAWQEPL